MKSRIIHLTIMALTAGVIAVSCNQQERKTAELQTLNDSMEHPKNTVDTLNGDRQEWEKFKMESQARIKQNQDSIDSFKKRLAKGNAKTKAKYEDKVTHLETLNLQMKKRVDEYKEEGRENWDKFKFEFKNDLDTLGRRMNEILAVDQK